MYFQLGLYDMIHHYNNLDQWSQTKSKRFNYLYYGSILFTYEWRYTHI